MEAIRSRCGSWFSSKPARFLLLCGVSLLLMAALSGAAATPYAITITDKGSCSLVYTSETDPRRILEREGIALGPQDILQFDGLQGWEGAITIHRAVPVRVYADGQAYDAASAGETIGELLARLGIRLGDQDRVSAPLSQEIAQGLELQVTRVETRRIQREAAVPFETEEIPTQTLAPGKSRVIQEGAAGRKLCTVEQTLADGQVTDELVLAEELLQEPRTRQVLVGNDTAPTSQLTPDQPLELDTNGNPVHYTKKVTGKATAYSSLGRPTKLVPGCVAMDLSQYPRGTQLYIKTPDGSYLYGYSEVRDTGPAVNEGIILVDLFFGSYEESCLFGAKTVDIYVL